MNWHAAACLFAAHCRAFINHPSGLNLTNLDHLPFPPGRLERELHSKQACLPAEPPADDPDAINLAVRLPAGGRYSRRFRRSDTLQVGGWAPLPPIALWPPVSSAVGARLARQACQRAVACRPPFLARCQAIRASSLLFPTALDALNAQRPLQAVFDFVDVQSGGGDILPGSYHLATSFPRRVLEDGAAGQSLADAGLTARQEALFLELK